MKRIVQTAIVILPLFAFLSGASAWQINLSGNGTLSNDIARAVALDGAGNVVAAGVIDNPGTGQDLGVVKFDGISGRELWRQAIHGTAVGIDGANAVAVDPAGDIIAAGFTENDGTGRDFTVVKFDGATGAELWRQAIDGGTVSSIDEARAIAVDAAGDVIVGGLIRGTQVFATGTSFSSLFVVKLGGAKGQELWRQVIEIADAGVVNSIAVDVAGNVLVAGVINRSHFSDFIVIKFDGAIGAELWEQLVTGTLGADGSNQALAVKVDAAGDVVAAGETTNSDTHLDFTVIKFDGASGQELWRQVINGSADSNDVANAVAIDAAGDVIAAGVIRNTGSDADFPVVKLNGTTGEVLWRAVTSDSGSPNDTASAVTVDDAGNVAAAGRIINSNSPPDFAVIKFDGETGDELWRQILNGTLNDDDEAFAVLVDAAGNIIAAGTTQNTDTGRDFTLVKFRGIDGGDFVPRTTLAVSPRVVRAGDRITAAWNGIATPTARDWIGLYLPGTANTKFIAWTYVSCSKRPRNPRPEGSCTLVVPADLRAGEYQLRLFANNFFSRLATSHVFRVVDDRPRRGRKEVKQNDGDHSPAF